MKNFITILLLASSLFAKSQTIDEAVRKVVTDEVNKRFYALKSGFDTVVTVQFTTRTATPTIFDTLEAPNNGDAMFQLSLRTVNTVNGEVGSAVKIVQVKNSNGVYIVTRDTNLATYSGQPTVLKATWGVLIINGLAVIRVVGVANTSINWTVTRINL